MNECRLCGYFLIHDPAVGITERDYCDDCKQMLSREDRLFRVMLNKNFVVPARDVASARMEACRILSELLNDGWFEDSDFVIIERVDYQSE